MDVISSPKTRLGPVEEVDITGDGMDDEVRLHMAERGPEGCRAFLVVVDGDEELVLPVWTAGEIGGLPQPSIFAFADVVGGEGAEIVLNEASGASTQFAGLYGFVGGTFLPLTVPDSDNGLFGFGGSVGHIEAVDCGADGAIVVSQAVPGEGLSDGQPLYELTRRFLELNGKALDVARTERAEVAIDKLGRYEEFASGPFASCPAP